MFEENPYDVPGWEICAGMDWLPVTGVVHGDAFSCCLQTRMDIYHAVPQEA
jgi:hypothetical protein